MTAALAPLRHRDFSLLIGGRVISLIGSQATTVALAWQVYVLTHDPLALGAIGLAKVIPVTVVALAGGLFADAFDRRTLLVLSSFAGALNSSALAVATFSDAVSLPLLYSCAAMSGVVSAVDNPARQALLPNLVPRDLLGRALSIGNAGFHLASVLGPAAGGFVLGHAGAGTVYVVDAVSYLAVVGACASMRHRGQASGVRVDLASIAEGIRFVRQSPVVRSSMMLDFYATLFAGATQLFPIFAHDLFRVGPRGLGILFAAPSVGAGMMAVWLTLRSPPRAQGRALLVSVGVYGLAMTAFGLVHSFALGALLLAISGAADTVSAVIRQILRQELTPDALRGRMQGILMIFFMGGPQLGEIEAGVVARLAGVRAAVWTGGVGAILLAGFYSWRAPWLRRYKSQ